MYIVVLTISQLYIEDQTLVINVHCGSHYFTAIHVANAVSKPVPIIGFV